MSLPVTAIIQARMSSSRLPGKVLRMLGDKPLLGHLVDRIKQCRDLDGIVVATSTEKTDDPIAEYCEKQGLRCYRGDLDNVYARFSGAIQKYDIKAFLRANADSPFLDPDVVNTGTKLFSTMSWDIITNTFRRSFPKGQSVEILKSETFLEAGAEIDGSFEQEHITQYFYKNSDRYKIFNFECSEGNFSQENLSIDIEDDFNLSLRILSELKGNELISWRELLQTKARLQA